MPWLTAAEKNKILVEWNATEVEYPADLCVHHMFETQVAKSPHSIAVMSDRSQMTYGELNQHANRLAHRLQKLGVRPDACVGICVERSVEMLIGVLGVLKAGGAYVPLDPAYPKERLAHMLADAKASILLTQRALAEELPSHVAEVICLDADWPVVARESSENPRVTGNRENLAYVLFTSGSTGRPKGVAIEHRSATNFVCWAQTVFTPAELSGTMFSTSLNFDLSVFEMFVPLSVGGKIILSTNALSLPSLRAANEVTLINTVPSAIAELVQMKGVPESVRVVNLAGEALPTTLVQEIYRTTKVQKVYNLYGPTEATTYSTFTLVKRDEEVTIGRPLANTQAYILDPRRRALPVGVPGELYLAGDGLARGYYGRTDLTSERFISNPFGTSPHARMYHTGDLCRFLRDGSIHYLGRKDNQVKIHGLRIELGEIEASLSRHPAVHSCVVSAHENSPGEKRLIACVVVARGQTLVNEDLRAFLKKSLPEYMVPRTFIRLDEFPLTPNGKVDRRSLPTPAQLGTEGERVPVEPRDIVELQLLNIWQQVLGRSPIGIRDDFFALGGHSILAMRVFAQIHAVFGQTLPVATLFEMSTVEQLADCLRHKNNSAAESSLVRLQAGGSKPPLFCVPGAGGNLLAYRDLIRHLPSEQPCYGFQPQLHFTRIEDMAAEYVREMHSACPTGPYYIKGWCIGGLVAFEMAQQLLAQGAEVGLLALIDTTCPPSDPIRIRDRMRYHLDESRKQKGLAIFDYIGREIRRVAEFHLRKIASSGLQTSAETNLAEADVKAAQAYKPQPFPGRLTLFWPKERPREVYTDSRRGWEGLARGGVEHHELPGEHHTMFQEPLVKMFAEELGKCLAEAQTKTEAGKVELRKSAKPSQGYRTSPPASLPLA
jgi:amino acid adenylation domain-containing protein